MVVVCGGLLQPPHLTLLSALGWDTRQPGPGHSDDDCMRGIADYGFVQVDATEYNLSMSMSFVFFLFMFICSKKFSGVLMLCSTQAAWQPTPIITTRTRNWHGVLLPGHRHFET